MPSRTARAAFFAACIFPLLAAGPPAAAQDRGVGLGLILGEPTGVSLKSWTGPRTAIDAAAAWSFDRDGSVHLHVDYLIHDFNLIRTRTGRLPVYYGIGGRLRLEDKTRIGVRLPVGMCYIFDDAPFDIFVELGPVFDLVPRTELTVAGFIGFRYYF
jgi:hypothetical protein